MLTLAVGEFKGPNGKYIFINFIELDMEMDSYHPSYGCGYVDTKSEILGYQRCHHRLEGTLCQTKGRANL